MRDLRFKKNKTYTIMLVNLTRRRRDINWWSIHVIDYSRIHHSSFLDFKNLMSLASESTEWTLWNLAIFSWFIFLEKLFLISQFDTFVFVKKKQKNGVKGNRKLQKICVKFAVIKYIFQWVLKTRDYFIVIAPKSKSNQIDLFGWHT